MKKNLLFLATATLALASCSNDELVERNLGNGINFRTSVQTRATETNNANLSSFYVTALNGNSVYFENVLFNKEEGATNFSSTPAYYWPSNGSLDFYAYSPAAEELGVKDGGATLTIDNTTKTLADFSPAADVADQVDFITASALSKTENTENPDIDLQFGHRLSQIVIMAKNTNTGYVYKVKGVRIAKAKSKNSYNFATNTWGTASEPVNYEVRYADGKEFELDGNARTLMAEDKDSKEAAMLLPQDLSGWDHAAQTYDGGAYLGVLVNVHTADGKLVYPAKENRYEWVAVSIDTDWDMGKKYVYTLNFAGGAGKVDPEKPGKGEEYEDEPVPDDDPFEPGKDIVGGPITFTAQVSPWNTDEPNNTEKNMVD